MIVVRSGAGEARQEIEANGHHVVADEPVDVDREIALHGALDESQRARLLAIADRCPVHRTLTSEIHISTQLV